MNGLAKQDALELEVANFGPIVEAKIDLRPLTVFVGPSNTGKSYLAILIYALHRFFEAGPYPIERPVTGPISQFLKGEEPYFHLPGAEFDRILQALREWEVENHERGAALSAPVVDLVLPLLRDVDGFKEVLDEEITRCFGVDGTKNLIRHSGSNKAEVTLQSSGLGEGANTAPFKYALAMTRTGPQLITVIPEGAPLRVEESPKRYGYSSRFLSWRDDIDRRAGVWEVSQNLANSVLSFILGPMSRPAHYLPADRTGIMHAHRVLLGSLLNRASQPGLRQGDPLPDLSGVVTDFLKQLIELGDLAERQSNKADALAKRIEQAILTGSVQIKTSEMGYPQFFYKPDGWKNALPLMNTSSMVSELAPIVLYLRHVVQPGETLIIEEPEAHLHPAMQVEFIRQIAAIVHAGVRVIVTTHSEWVLEELGNIVQRSKLPEARRKKIPQGDFALRPDQVGAWLFKPKLRPRGSVVKEIKLDEETGLYPTDYDDVSLALYNDSVDIFNRIQARNTQ
ncbi:MAG: AAA family ATPase [Gemmatimonadota bacterium]|nr:AAA family ATPase [Gemmatimonadota bacterium]